MLFRFAFKYIARRDHQVTYNYWTDTQLVLIMIENQTKNTRIISEENGDGETNTAVCVWHESERMNEEKIRVFKKRRTWFSSIFWIEFVNYRNFK